MNGNGKNGLIYSLKDLCKVCYTCVRECPAKAIQIRNGQSEVIAERCIACGNCVTVCSQGAKAYHDSKPAVLEMLKSGKTALLLAPSFPAEFREFQDFSILVGMLRKLGFNYVIENAIGADIVAQVYEKLINEEIQSPHISSDCPAIVKYITLYHPNLAQFMASVVSPMIASARIARREYGEDLKIVFAGPCIAKKQESNEVNEVLTFTELRELLKIYSVSPETTEPSDFDPPHPGKGAIFPVTRGMLAAVNKTEDICEGNVVIASGRASIRDALKEFEAGMINSYHLELLCCEGCIMGPGMSKGSKKYSRRKMISNYVKQKLDSLDKEEWAEKIKQYEDIDLYKEFKVNPTGTPIPSPADIDQVLEAMGKLSPRDHLNCGACGYETCVEHAVAIVEGLAETEMCLPFTIDTLHKSNEALNRSNEKLANAQQALKQSEKLAHMGQLSAGIAHELNNPLGVITMYSNILIDEIGDGHHMKKDLELIAEQANRCKSIVGSLLNFARKNQLRPVLTDLDQLISRSLDSIIRPDNISVVYKSGLTDPEVLIDPDQIMQVLTNLEKNAVDAMPDGGSLTLETQNGGPVIEIKISDTGIGIPKENIDKLFTPFFTTKKIGRGTGLGLSLVYGIIKIHKGQIAVKSNADPGKGPTGTTFTINLPVKKET
jgi:two-component system NtrC family sensor kinase